MPSAENTTCVHALHLKMYLNLTLTVVEAIDGYDAKGPDVYVLEEVWCSGNETSLLDCPHSGMEYTECEESYVAGVKCLSGKYVYTYLE